MSVENNSTEGPRSHFKGSKNEGLGEVLLEVEDLSIAVDASGLELVRGVSFSLREGESLGIVGESGAGKSLTALGSVRLLDGSGTTVSGGSVRFQGADLWALPDRQARKLLGEEIGYIFQDASTSLNPLVAVGNQIAELFTVRRGLSRREARERVIELLERVRIASASDRYGSKPAEFSGGMKQRVMIAMAVALQPSLLVADECTTGLDVTVQAGVLELIRELRAMSNQALLFISHDLRVISQIVDRVIVMYAGVVIEEGPVERVFTSPRHPYTEALIDTIPTLDFDEKTDGRDAAVSDGIPGVPPSHRALPSGCKFHPRCVYAEPECTEQEPPLFEVHQNRRSRCIRVDEIYG